MIAAAMMGTASLVAGYGLIWAAYGFRFAPTPDPNGLFNDTVIDVCRYRETLVAHGSPERVPMSVLNEWAKDWRPSRTVKTAQWINAHRIFPQAWTEGLLYTYGASLTRPTFLLGQTSISGWWYYFPLAILFKTPLATLGAILLAAIFFRWWKLKTPDYWRFCASICPVFYFAIAVRSHLNLGIRHILPVYPFLFLFIGVAAARSWQRWPRAAGTLISLFVIGLAIETLSAFPDFIPFFNVVAAAGSRGGLDLLSDSNIDWGQDLPALARWQGAHPDRPLYLCYFGSSDPRLWNSLREPSRQRCAGGSTAAAHAHAAGDCDQRVDAARRRARARVAGNLRSIPSGAAHRRSGRFDLSLRSPARMAAGSREARP